MKQPAGVILAGGNARRMGGGDKCLLPLGGGVVLDQVVARLEPQVAKVALNANGDAARFAGFGLPVLADGVADAGPLAGVLAGLDWAAGCGFDAIVTVAADTPFFPCDLVPRLLLAGNGGLAVAVAERVHPTFALWPVARRGEVREAVLGGTRRVLELCDAMGAAHAPFSEPEAETAFFNINTPEDLAKAAARV
ncbi:molybdenum cofactor guanylyltransferase MobA [Thalassovita taeanensis]|uniref:Molybdenum cofactor guanylyltransferase n=1 Tax=Thalassovita taeanensis TaxID=657014 RepID=A0A1H9ARF8_9RHOB|nr:molybdenum cofactor guanylyltransferase MobA [Thalassovita taeanensis]SEP79374.1 molybdenum cofactor guanylyltransferase [Thalassovita taeanensis]